MTALDPDGGASQVPGATCGQIKSARIWRYTLRVDVRGAAF